MWYKIILKNNRITITISCLISWRREWDSNPRYGFPHTRFPSVRLKPLGHLSGCPLLKGQADFCKGSKARSPLFPPAIEFYRYFLFPAEGGRAAAESR